MAHKEKFIASILDLLWSHWSLLGVRGISDHAHVTYAIALEELLILTAEVSQFDPRLRDEALDWCIGSGRFISKPRLKTLLNASGAETREAFGAFSAILTEHLSGSWPEQRAPEFSFTPTHKSTAPDLSQPPLLPLRLRALFGMGARADILLSALAWPAATFTASELTFVGYTKRNIAIALDSLAEGGLLDRTTVGNRAEFSWQRGNQLIALIQPIPESIPRWPAIQRVLSSWLHLFIANDSRSSRLAAISANKAFQALASDLNSLALKPPLSKPLDWGNLADWIAEQAQALSRGSSAMLHARAVIARKEQSRPV